MWLLRLEPATEHFHIVTANHLDNDHQLYRLLPNDKGLVQLTDIPGREIIKTWSPNGHWFYFYSEGTQQLYRTHILTRRREEIGPPNAYVDSWSPDGQWLFISEENNIHRLQPDGSKMQLVISNAENISRWSEDGEWIYPNVHRFDALYRVQPNGGDPQPLTHEAGLYNLMGWSPDGEWLIARYIDNSPEQNPSIIRVRADGSETQYLTAESSDFDRWLGENPHGDQIIQRYPAGYSLANNSSEEESAISTAIIIVNSAGQEIPLSTIPHNSRWHLRGWTPDGEWFVLRTTLNRYGQTYRVHPSADPIVNISMSCHRVVYWWYDHESIVCLNDNKPAFSTIKIDVATGKDERLDLGAFELPNYLSPVPIEMDWQPALLFISSLILIAIAYFAPLKRIFTS